MTTAYTTKGIKLTPEEENAIQQDAMKVYRMFKKQIQAQVESRKKELAKAALKKSKNNILTKEQIKDINTQLNQYRRQLEQSALEEKREAEEDMRNRLIEGKASRRYEDAKSQESADREERMIASAINSGPGLAERFFNSIAKLIKRAKNNTHQQNMDTGRGSR